MSTTLLAKLLAVLAALVVVLTGISSTLKHIYPSSDTASSLGANFVNVETNVPNYVNGLGLGSIAVNMAKTYMVTGSSTSMWKNSTGRPVVVTYVELAFVSGSSTNMGLGMVNSSSTFEAFVVSSSTASGYPTGLLYTAPTATASTTLFINGFLFATSSLATTTSSLGAQGSANNRTIIIPDGGSMVTLLQPTSLSAVCGQPIAALTDCETATSTVRGFNILTTIFYHSI